MSRRRPDDDRATSRDIPLIRKFPALARIPRVALGAAPTPVESLESLSRDLWIKRDDLAGTPLGGNKVRALEFLLANVARGDVVATVGSVGSTHALAVATYCAALGAEARIGRWRQEMNPAAERVAERLSRIVKHAPVFRTPVGAYAWAMRERIRGARWIAAGGSTPLGVLGHVNAGLELIEQVDAGLVRYVEFPDALKGRYQSFTQADISQLRQAGYTDGFQTVAEGIERYTSEAMNRL